MAMLKNRLSKLESKLGVNVTIEDILKVCMIGRMELRVRLSGNVFKHPKHGLHSNS